MARDLLRNPSAEQFGQAVLGNLEYERGRLFEAVRHFERALALEPNDSDTLVMLTFTLQGAGQDEAAQALAPRLIASDPLSPSTWMAAGGPLWFVGQGERGIPIIERGIQIDPHNFVVHWCLGYACALVGQIDKAKRHAAELERLVAGAAYTKQLWALIDGLEGRRQSAIDRLAGINIKVLDAHQQFHLAESFIAAGDLDRGLDLLEHSNAGFHPYGYMAHHCRFLDPVRHLPRFEAVLALARARTEAFSESMARNAASAS
jgi:tetratricopeptide (TPR) repeat protein